MKLILTQEVDGLGAAGDVVEVKDGYGRNYLVPRGLGIRWTRGGEKQIESIKAARASREVRDLDHVAGSAQAGDLLGEDELHRMSCSVSRVSARWTCREGGPPRGRS